MKSRECDLVVRKYGPSKEGQISFILDNDHNDVGYKWFGFIRFAGSKIFFQNPKRWKKHDTRT